MRKHKNLIIVWILMMLISTIDLITTIIALDLGAREINPIGRWFFQFGFFGFVSSWLFMSVFLLTIIFLIVMLCDLIYIALEKKELTKKQCSFLYSMLATIYIILILTTIESNIRIIRNLI